MFIPTCINCTSLFYGDRFVISASEDYENDTLITIPYGKFRWLIETETFYVLLAGTKLGWLEWFSPFGMINKIAIEQAGKKEELLDFLKTNCPKLKFNETQKC